MSGFVFDLREGFPRAVNGRATVWIFVCAQPFLIAGLKLLSPDTAMAAPFALFSAAIALSAAAAGIRPALAVTALSAALGTVLFVPPSGTIVPERAADAGLIAVFAVEGALVSVITGTLRNALATTRARAR